MKILRLSSSNQEKIIKKTLAVLKSGGLVVFPSDTVYGLLCDATNPSAVDKLLKFKERPAGKAISVFVADKEMAEKYVIINPNAANIVKNLLPGPFTLICKIKFEILNPKYETNSNDKNPNDKNKNVLNLENSNLDIVSNFDIRISDLNKIDPRLLAENGTLGFRIPDYPLINKLLITYGLPLTATSANKSGAPPHYSINSFLKARPCSLPRAKSRGKASPYDEINLIIDAGKLPFNKPSTVIDTTSGELKTLRMGDLLPATSNSLISRNENETSELARFILSKAGKNTSGKPIVFLLKGELGTGKTVFTKGLAKALGIKENVISPTYTLCYEYRMTLQCHSERMVSDSRTRAEESLRNIRRDASISVGMTDRIDQPIINGGGFDTKGLHQNTNYVEQNSNYCHSGLDPESINIDSRLRGNDEGVIYSQPTPTTPPTTHNSPSLLIHYDLYRIESLQDLTEIKFLESIKPGNIYSVEWPERIDEKTLLKLKEIAQIVFVEIKHVDEGTREIWWSDGADYGIKLAVKQAI